MVVPDALILRSSRMNNSAFSESNAPVVNVNEKVSHALMKF